MANAGEQDLVLKARIHRILWLQGYHTRLNVKVASYDQSVSSPMELTDLDVLGVRLSTDYRFDQIMADCTTRSISPIARAFWLRGVMDYLGGVRGYLVLSRSVPPHERSIAARLSVDLLNEADLEGLERRYNNGRLPNLKMFEPEGLTYLHKNLGALSKALAPIQEYRKYYFWMNEDSRNIFGTVSVVRRHREDLNSRDKFHRALILEIFTLFCLALLRMCSYLFHSNPENLTEATREFLHGGVASLRNREELLRDIRALVEAVPGQQDLFAREGLIDKLKLDPPYFNDLMELVVRLVSRPTEVAEILRYLQLILYEKLLFRGAAIRELIGGQYSEITLKLLKDAAIFYVKASEIDPALLAEVQEA